MKWYLIEKIKLREKLLSVENVVIKPKQKTGSYYEHLQDIEIKSSEDSQCESEDMREKDQIKFRDIHMKDAFLNIDKFKIENMRKIRLQKYDKVKIGFHYTED